MATADVDDDWPARYSWLNDDENSESPEPSESLESSESAEPPESPVTDTVIHDEQDEPVHADEPPGSVATDAVATDTHAVATDEAEADDATRDHPVLDDSTVDVADDDSTVDTAGDDTADDDGTSGQPGSVKLVTVVPGVPRYHDGNCILIRFMQDDDVQKVTIPAARETGCTPCAACQPED